MDLGIELAVRREASYRLSQPPVSRRPSMLLTECPDGARSVYFEKIRVFKAGWPPEYSVKSIEGAPRDRGWDRR